MNDENDKPKDDGWGMTMPHMRYQENKDADKDADDFSDEFLLDLDRPANPPKDDEWGMTAPNLNVPDNHYSSSDSGDSDFFDGSDFDKTTPNLNIPKDSYSWEDATPTPPVNPPSADEWGMSAPDINLPPENKSNNWEMDAPDFNPPAPPPPKQNSWAMPSPVFRVSDGENIEDVKKTAAFKLSDLQDFDMNTMDFKPSDASSSAPDSFDKTTPSFNFHENKPPIVSNASFESAPLPPQSLPSNSSIEAIKPPEQKKKSKLPLVIGGLFAMTLLAGVFIAGVYFLFLKSPVETASKIASPIEPETARDTSAPPAPLSVAPTVALTNDLPKQIEYKGAMVLVSAGEFTMGSDTGADESKPAHKVDLPAYYIDKTEVTNAEYKAFCDATGKQPPTNPHIEKDYFTARPNAPVVGVSFADAKSYAEWAGKRLPTEEEWEKAASWDEATQAKREFPWGNDFKKSDAAFQTAKISDVGKFSAGASPSGALDMAGNVLEWVDAYFQPYPNSTVSNPEFGETNRIVRGGHFASRSSDSLKTTKRIYIPPTVASGEDDEKLTAAIIGFRCAVSADTPAVGEVLRANGK